MKDPDFAHNLHGVYNAKGVRVPRERNLKDAGAEAFERFGYIRLAVLCRNRQSCQADGLRLDRKLFELLAGGLDPRD